MVGSSSAPVLLTLLVLFAVQSRLSLASRQIPASSRRIDADSASLTQDQEAAEDCPSANSTLPNSLMQDKEVAIPPANSTPAKSLVQDQAATNPFGNSMPPNSTIREQQALIQDHADKAANQTHMHEYEWQLVRQSQQEKLDTMLLREQALINQTILNEPALKEQQLHHVNTHAAVLKSIADEVHIKALDFIGNQSAIPAPSLEQLSSQIVCTVGGAVGTVAKTVGRVLSKTFSKVRGKSDKRSWVVNGRTPGCLCTSMNSVSDNAVVNVVKAPIGLGSGDACHCTCCTKEWTCTAFGDTCHWYNDGCWWGGDILEQ